MNTVGTVFNDMISEFFFVLIVFRFINGIIKIDKKIALLLPVFMVHQRLISKRFWNITFTSSIIYFIGYEVYYFYLWPPQTIGIASILVYFFNLPNIIDFTVIITTCFYLSNIGFRFQTVNNFWKRLPDGLVSVRGEWTQSEIIMLTESIRLLHAELSELLKMFSLGYGPMLLGFFICSFIDMVFIFYVTLSNTFLTNVSYIDRFFKFIPLSIYKVQTIVCMISIVVAASWINEKVYTWKCIYDYIFIHCIYNSSPFKHWQYFYLFGTILV